MVPRGGIAENSHDISTGNTIIAQIDNRDAVQRGVTYKYIPATSALSVIICFRCIRELEGIREAMQFKNTPLVYIEDESFASDATDDGDAWPLHSDMEYNGSKVMTIDLSN